MVTKRAIVIGAGVGGLSAAVALRQAGLEVDVFEQAAQPRAEGTALGIMSNAVSALRSLGIEGALETRGQVLQEFHIRTDRGRLIASMPVKAVSEELGAPSVSIHRAALQEVLLEAAASCGLHYGAACTGFETDHRQVRAHFADGRTAQADILIGADGFHSAVRRQLLGVEPVQYAGYVCWLATVPFAHPRLTTGHVGHYWGKGKRFGLVDIGAGQAYWWGTENRSYAAGLDLNGSAKTSAERAFAGWPDEVTQAIRNTPASAVLQTRAQDRPFSARWGLGRVTLLGDAAHPMLTSLGQGACMAIEDAVVLGRAATGSRDLIHALRRYELLRRERTRQMVLLSRVLSRIEQFEHPLPVALRNAYFRLNPRRAVRNQSTPLLTFSHPS